MVMTRSSRLCAMVITSFTTAVVSQEVRMAVAPKGDVIPEPQGNKYGHEPMVRVSNYGMSGSMASKVGKGFGNPFHDLENMNDKIKDALKKKREMELAHQSVAHDGPSRIRKMLKQKNLQGMKGLEGVLNLEHPKLTSVQCQGVARNKTCSFKNLYFEPGPEPTFWVYAKKGDDIPDMEGLSLASKYGGPAPVAVYKFEDKDEAAEAIRHLNPKHQKGLTLVYSTIWHQNMGHALWDGLYPAYTALMQWDRQDEKFHSVVDHASECYQASTEDGRCMSENVMKTFGQGEFMSMHKLRDEKGWHVFSEVIMGSGNKGARVINRDYSLPNGNVNGNVRSFRDRMYTSYGLTPPRERTGSAQHRNGPRSMRGVVVSNAKYSRTEKAMLHHLTTAAGSMATSFTETDGVSGNVNLQYVDWEDLRHFKQHLELIRHTDVHMSAVGTPSCLAPLLPDGSVHINLGNNEWPGGQEFSVHGQPQLYSDSNGVSYMEEYWAEGVPYIRALYYNATTQPQGLKRRELQTLAQKAYHLIHSNYMIPVQPGENLSPVGKIFKEYCYSDEKACEYALNLMNGEVDEKEATKTKECQSHAWAEMAVFEVGPFGEDGHNGLHCSLHNIEKLREIREKHLGNTIA